MTARGLIAIAAALLLAGCASGLSGGAKPPAGAAGPFVSQDASAVDTAATATWWRLFDDPVVDQLVTDALAANRDLAVAAANLKVARAALDEQRAARLPTTSTSASYTRGRASASAQGLTQPLPDADTYDVGLDASYEVDIFGRVHKAIAAARADARVSQAIYDGVRVTVAAETARAYADGCSAARELAVAHQTLDLQQQSFTLTQRRFAAGRDSPGDVAQAKALLAQTSAALPGFEAARQSALFRLATLSGRPPSRIPEAAKACAAAPEVTHPLPVGDGAALLDRRPDIREAWNALAATSARLGVAQAALFPTVSLGATVGSTAVNSNLTSPAAFRWSVGPLISWSFPNLVAAAAGVRQAKASDEAALASYQGVILSALQDTETALTTYARELDRRQSLREARDQNREAARIVQIRYAAGRDAFLTLLDAQRALAASEADLAASDAAVANDQIAVFKALGGGWEREGAKTAG